MVGEISSSPIVTLSAVCAQSDQACRSATVPTAVGYPGAFAAAFNASVITVGVASTGVPIDKSIIPSG